MEDWVTSLERGPEAILRNERCGQPGRETKVKQTHKTIGVIAGILLLGACGNSEASRKRMIETGNKYFTNSDYKTAALVYRRVIQKNPREGEAYYRLGLTELRLGRYAEALRSLRRASELQPGNEDAHARLGELYLMVFMANQKLNRQYLEDLTELSGRMLKRNPKSVEGLRLKGYAGVAGKDQKIALEAFQEAVRLKPDSGQLMTAYAQALAANGRAEEGEKSARDHLRRDKSYGPIYDFLYLRKLALRDIPGAEAVLKEKVANNPAQSNYILELATHYLRARNPELMKSTLDTITARPKEFPDGRMVVGDFYHRIGDHAAAYKEYESGLKDSPAKRATYQKKLIELLAIQGRNREAAQMAEVLSKENPNDDQTKAIRAALRLRGGDRAELDIAISEFQSVISRMPDNPVVRFNYGEALLAKGLVDRAKVQFTESMKVRSTYLPPKLALARLHLAAREFPRALALADEILLQQPNLVNARVLRASALIGNRDFASARRELESTIERTPGNRDARHLLAMIDYREKRFDAAEKAFRGLLEANPPDPRALAGLVEVMISTNRAPAASKMLEAMLKTNPPEAARIRLAIAYVALRTKDYDRAAGVYREVVKEQPKSQELWLRLGETYRRAERFDEALKAFEAARDIDPQQVAPWLQMSVVMEVTKNRSNIRPVYEQILKLAPDNPLALNNLAYLLAENGVELDQALTLAQRARQKMPNDTDVADTLGWVYIKKNLSDDAIKIFRDLLVREPRHVSWRYNLAMALFQKGDKLQARKELEEALRNAPTHNETSKIRELLSRIG
jgi:tetratricopeptide (TPR) repeat protein